MIKLVKPMLAKPHYKCKNFDPLGWYASGKVDGLRQTVQEDPFGLDVNAYARSLKIHRNLHLQKLFARKELIGCDGEVVAGGHFNSMSGALRKRDGEPDATFWVFDMLMDVTFHERLIWMSRAQEKLESVPHVKLLPHFRISTNKGVQYYNDYFVERGFEGVVFRHPDGMYKEGPNRSPHLVKVKNFDTLEAEVAGFGYLEHNHNEQVVNELGQMKRSTHAENKETDYSRVGYLVCKSPVFSETFHVGTGFSHAQSRDWVDNKPSRIEFKYQMLGSTAERPRGPAVYLKTIS